MKVTVKASIVIDGWHQWIDAPARQDFLRVQHRHQFLICGEIECIKLDREVECFDIADAMRAALKVFASDGTHYFGHRSCEMIAEHLVRCAKLDRCEVLEDGLQGASVERDPA